MSKIIGYRIYDAFFNSGKETREPLYANRPADVEFALQHPNAVRSEDGQQIKALQKAAAEYAKTHANQDAAAGDDFVRAKPTRHAKVLGTEQASPKKPTLRIEIDADAAAETHAAQWQQLKEAVAAGKQLEADARLELRDDAGMVRVLEGQTYKILGLAKNEKYDLDMVILQSPDKTSEPSFKDGTPVDGKADGVFEYCWLSMVDNFACIHNAGQRPKSSVAAVNQASQAEPNVDVATQIHNALSATAARTITNRAELMAQLQADLAPFGIGVQSGSQTYANVQPGNVYIEIGRSIATQDIIDVARHELTHIKLGPLQAFQRATMGPLGIMLAEAQADFGAGLLAGMNGQAPTGLIHAVSNLPADAMHGPAPVRAARAMAGAAIGRMFPWLRFVPGADV